MKPITNNIKDLFDQGEVFSLPVSRLHKVYLTPETHLTFNNLTNALNTYGQSRSRVLIEDLGNDGCLVYHRDLANSPVKARDLNVAIKLVSELL